MAHEELAAGHKSETDFAAYKGVTKVLAERGDIGRGSAVVARAEHGEEKRECLQVATRGDQFL